jgi:hypothetical protein
VRFLWECIKAWLEDTFPTPAELDEDVEELA